MSDTHELVCSVDALTVQNRLESMYVYFREGVRIKEGLKFRRDPFGRILVYVGGDGIPVALQFVDGPLLDEACSEAEHLSPGDLTDDQVCDGFLHLFGIACKMVAFYEARNQKLGNDLIEDALRTAKRLPPKGSRDGCPV